MSDACNFSNDSMTARRYLSCSEKGLGWPSKKLNCFITSLKGLELFSTGGRRGCKIAPASSVRFGLGGCGKRSYGDTAFLLPEDDVLCLFRICWSRARKDTAAPEAAPQAADIDERSNECSPREAAHAAKTPQLAEQPE